MKSRRLIFGPSSQGRFAGYRIGGDQSAGARASGSASGCRWGERCAGPTQPRDHPQILAIPYFSEMIVGRAVESSKRQSLPQGICGAHAAEHWCGNTDSRITTGIEVGRIRRVRLSLRDGWSNCSYSKSEPGQKGPTRQSRRHRDRSSGAQHLETDSSCVGAFKFSTSHPPTCWGSSMRMNLILAPSRTILLSRSTVSLQKGKMDRARSHPPDCRSGPNGWVTQRRALAGVWLAYAL